MRVRALAAVAAIAALLPVSAAAQSPLLTDEQLTTPVVVTRDGSSERIKGRILSIDDRTVTLDVGGTRLDVPFASVAQIDYQRDSLKNGAIIGGLALGIWCAVICRQAMPEGGQAAVATAVNAGFGALVGAGLDAMIGRRPPIYRRPSVPRPDAGAAAAVGFTVRF